MLPYRHDHERLRQYTHQYAGYQLDQDTNPKSKTPLAEETELYVVESKVYIILTPAFAGVETGGEIDVGSVTGSGAGVGAGRFTTLL